MKKTTLLISALFLLGWGTPPAHAFIPLSGVSSLKVQLYALYTSADPTCQTGLVATVPMSKTAVTVDVMQGPQVGSNASTSSTINCIVWVTGNTTTATIGAGPFTSTSTWSSTNTNNSDSPCTGGKTIGPQMMTAVATTINWPTQIKTDLASAGLSAITSTTGLTDVIPIYVSTDSKCTDQYQADSAISGCTWSGSTPTSNPFNAPTAANDTAHGVNLSASISSGSSTGYKMVINPVGMFGGNSGSCSQNGFPLATFGTK
jgi:hypothetical protein